MNEDNNHEKQPVFYYSQCCECAESVSVWLVSAPFSHLLPPLSLLLLLPFLFLLIPPVPSPPPRWMSCERLSRVSAVMPPSSGALCSREERSCSTSQPLDSHSDAILPFETFLHAVAGLWIRHLSFDGFGWRTVEKLEFDSTASVMTRSNIETPNYW